jgi:agmatinase
MTNPIKMLGVPTDSNSSHLRGPAKAPAAIRSVLFSGMSNLCAEDGTDLADPAFFQDRGDMDIHEDKGDFERIAEASKAAFTGGPAVFLGGDHFVTWPLIDGYVRAGNPPQHLVHIDAHPDLYPDFEGNPHSHASPMARLFENERIASLTQIGIRTINPVQQAQIDKYDVQVISPGELNRLPGALPKGPTYLTIDLDGLDPAYAPGVSHHEPGGLSVRDVINIIARLPGRLIGGDIVELNPNRDINEMTAAVAVKLLKEMVARIANDRD